MCCSSSMPSRYLWNPGETTSITSLYLSNCFIWSNCVIFKGASTAREKYELLQNYETHIDFLKGVLGEFDRNYSGKWTGINNMLHGGSGSFMSKLQEDFYEPLIKEVVSCITWSFDTFKIIATRFYFYFFILRKQLQQTIKMLAMPWRKILRLNFRKFRLRAKGAIQNLRMTRMTLNPAWIASKKYVNHLIPINYRP